MLKTGDDMQAGDRPDVNKLLEVLLRNAQDWAQAEVTLAQIELADLKLKVVKIAGLVAIGFSLLICILFALVQGGIAVLAQHASAPGAALIMAAILAVPFAWCAHAAYSAAPWRTASVFFRWFGAEYHKGKQ